MAWKKRIVDNYRTLWTKGKDWIYIDVATPGMKAIFPEDNFNVGAKRRINEETLNGHFKSFKTRAQAQSLVNAYLRSY